VIKRFWFQGASVGHLVQLHTAQSQSGWGCSESYLELDWISPGMEIPQPLQIFSSTPHFPVVSLFLPSSPSLLPPTFSFSSSSFFVPLSSVLTFYMTFHESECSVLWGGFLWRSFSCPGHLCPSGHSSIRFHEPAKVCSFEVQGSNAIICLFLFSKDLS